MSAPVRSILAAALLACVVGNSAVCAQDVQRGLRNYQEIMSGKKTLQELSPQEREEVLMIFKRLRTLRQGSNRSPECTDALDRAESAASELADYARRLRNCAEAQDYSDDCSAEFRRVRNAHSDYESAVSDVSSYCR